jgi:hypothetical protein
LPPTNRGAFFKAVFIVQQTLAAFTHSLKKSRRNLHNAEGVLKSRVHRTRIDHVGPSELPNAAQPLKRRMIDNIPLELIEPYEPMHRVTDLEMPQGEYPSFAFATEPALA